MGQARARCTNQPVASGWCAAAEGAQQAQCHCTAHSMLQGGPQEAWPSREKEGLCAARARLQQEAQNHQGAAYSFPPEGVSLQEAPCHVTRPCASEACNRYLAGRKWHAWQGHTCVCRICKARRKTAILMSSTLRWRSSARRMVCTWPGEPCQFVGCDCCCSATSTLNSVKLRTSCVCAASVASERAFTEVFQCSSRLTCFSLLAGAPRPTSTQPPSWR